MNWSRAILYSVIGTMLVSCAATPVRRSFKESVNDSIIKTAVRIKLTKDKEVKARHMGINVWRGVVELHGRALSNHEKMHAEEVARRVKNVVAVENYLKVVGEPIAPVATVAAPAAAPASQSAPAVPVVTARSAGLVANQQIPAPKVVATRPTVSTVPSQPQRSSQPTVVKPHTTATAKVATQQSVVQPVAHTTQPSTPVSTVAHVAAKPEPAVAPLPKVRAVAHGGKTLPWLGEVVDEEGPALQPVKEIAERPSAAVVSGKAAASQPSSVAKPAVAADEDLAREAAEELKRLKGTSSH